MSDIIEHSGSQLVAYPAIFKNHPSEEGKYTVSFPDLNNAIAHGETLAEAIQSGMEALMLMSLSKKEFPSSSSLKEIHAKYPDYEVTIITADLADTEEKLKIPMEHEIVTLPLPLVLEAIEHGLDLSKILRESLESKLEKIE